MNSTLTVVLKAQMHLSPCHVLSMVIFRICKRRLYMTLIYNCPMQGEKYFLSTKEPRGNLMHGINIVLYKYSTICFLLCIKKSGPSVINKEPFLFIFPGYWKGKKWGWTETLVLFLLSAFFSHSVLIFILFLFYFVSV